MTPVGLEPTSATRTERALYPIELRGLAVGAGFGPAFADVAHRASCRLDDPTLSRSATIGPPAVGLGFHHGDELDKLVVGHRRDQLVGDVSEPIRRLVLDQESPGETTLTGGGHDALPGAADRWSMA